MVNQVPRRALVISTHPATIRASQQVLGAIGCRTTPVPALSAAPVFAGGELTFAVLDLDILPDGDPAAMVADLATRCPGTTLVAVAGRDTRRRLIRAMSHPNVAHGVPKLLSPPAVVGERLAIGPDERDLFAALWRHVDPAGGPSLGVTPYLLGIATTQELAVDGTRGRAEAVDAVVAFGERMHLHEEKLRRIEVLGEELILNALFDAPTDTDGSQRFAGIDRKSSIRLAPAERVQLSFGCDGRNFAISITDHFGSLDRATIVAQLARRLAADPSPGLTDGAGMGLAMAFNAANQMIFTLHPQRLTEVVAVVDVASSNRASQERGTALHFFD